MEKQFIPLSVPNFGGNEKEYVNDAVVSEWVSSGGSKVSGFEETIAKYVGMPGAVACNSGTSGLHLALLVSGVKAGQEVIAPTLTFIAAVNPIRYVGAEPVFVGCDETLCIDVDAVEKFCQEECEYINGELINKTTHKKVAAILPVHVFGNMCNMPRIMELAKKYNLVVIEDATEALGTYYTEGEYKGKYAGTIGDIGVFSFNGNKLITTGSGGMVVSNRPEWAAHAKHLSTQAKTDELQFCHDEVGYNYRLTNLQAALGLAQMEQVEGFIARKEQMYNQYKQGLDGKAGLRLLPFNKDIRPNRWFFSLYLENYSMKRDDLMTALSKEKIQTRPIWALIHEQKPYVENQVFAQEKAQDFRAKIINIPCSTNLEDADIQRVINTILELAE